MVVHWAEGAEERSVRQRLKECTVKLRDAYRWRAALLFVALLALTACAINCARVFSGDVRVLSVAGIVVPLAGFVACAFSFVSSRLDIHRYSDRLLQLREDLDSVLLGRESDG